MGKGNWTRKSLIHSQKFYILKPQNKGPMIFLRVQYLPVSIICTHKVITLVTGFVHIVSF